MARARRHWAVSSLTVGKCSHSSRVEGVGRCSVAMVGVGVWFNPFGSWHSCVENKIGSLTSY